MEVMLPDELLEYLGDSYVTDDEGWPTFESYVREYLNQSVYH